MEPKVCTYVRMCGERVQLIWGMHGIYVGLCCILSPAYWSHPLARSQSVLFSVHSTGEPLTSALYMLDN